MPLRRALAADAPALIDICVRTGHRGQDARGVYTDPSLLPAMYLLPYLVLAPDWCWVLDEAGAPAGYLVGTPDSRDFMQRAEAACWPRLRALHPLPALADDTLQARLTRVLHASTAALPFLDSHPAHLHIDLLPHAQGRGHGAALMACCIAALQSSGVPGVHLGVSAHNPRALDFYRHLGFETLQEAAWGRWLGRRL